MWLRKIKNENKKIQGREKNERDKKLQSYNQMQEIFDLLNESTNEKYGLTTIKC